jgi:hypothetical protein
MATPSVGTSSDALTRLSVYSGEARSENNNGSHQPRNSGS